MATPPKPTRLPEAPLGAAGPMGQMGPPSPRSGGSSTEDKLQDVVNAQARVIATQATLINHLNDLIEAQS